MALENLIGTDKFIDDLTATNPVIVDDVSEGDDHIRGIKNVLKNTFPNVTGAVSATETELNNAQQNVQSDWGATSGDDFIKSKPTLGTSSTLDVANASTDASNTEVVRGDDTRLGDARAPTAHNHDGSYATAAQGTKADNALPRAGGTMAGALDFDDGVKANFGNHDDLQIYHDGSASYINENGTGNLVILGANLQFRNSANTKNYFVGADNGAATLYFNGNDRLATTVAGIDVTGTTTTDSLVVEGGITETQPSGTSGTTYTVDLANGTIFNLTNAASVAITMPDEAAGKSFTIITKLAPSWVVPTGSVAIKWASATVPSAQTLSIYSFICDGTTWFGMEAGNGFA